MKVPNSKQSGKKTCKSCSGLGIVDNYVNGNNFKEECQICKGKGELPLPRTVKKEKV